MYSRKNPKPWISLDVDKQAHHLGSQVENIVMKASEATNGVYKYFVRYYSGHGRNCDFTYVINEFDEECFEGKGKNKNNPRDVPIVDITIKDGKVESRKFHNETKKIPALFRNTLKGNAPLDYSSD